MARTTFQGPVRSLGGIYQQGPASVVSITASTTLNPVDHGGRIISVGGTLAADITLTLPTIDASANPTTSGPGQDPSTTNNQGYYKDIAKFGLSGFHNSLVDFKCGLSISYDHHDVPHTLSVTCKVD